MRENPIGENLALNVGKPHRGNHALNEGKPHRGKPRLECGKTLMGNKPLLRLVGKPSWGKPLL
jgi:hypothetical protein